MIRLLLADDEDLIRGALAPLLELEADLTVVAEAATTTEAVRLAHQHRPDIAVLDLEMPPADGLRAAEEIRAALPTRIVMVTRHARPAVLRRALQAGVSGFVPKTTPAARLAEILRDVATGRRYVDPDIAASALTENDCPLTDRELQVLRASRTGASISEIATQVHLAPGTVRNYLSAGHVQAGSQLAARGRPPRLGAGLDLTRPSADTTPQQSVKGKKHALSVTPRDWLAGCWSGQLLAQQRQGRAIHDAAAASVGGLPGGGFGAALGVAKTLVEPVGARVVGLGG